MPHLDRNLWFQQIYVPGCGKTPTHTNKIKSIRVVYSPVAQLVRYIYSQYHLWPSLSQENLIRWTSFVDCQKPGLYYKFCAIKSLSLAATSTLQPMSLPLEYIHVFDFSSEKLYRIAQHRTAQHSTAQHSTAQHSTAQHSTAYSIV